MRHSSGTQPVRPPVQQPVASARRQVVAALQSWDSEVFRRTATAQSPALGALLPLVTTAADYGVLWMTIGGALWSSKRRSARRAAGRGLSSLAIASLLANQMGKRGAATR